jgi:hypothetical protein
MGYFQSVFTFSSINLYTELYFYTEQIDITYQSSICKILYQSMASVWQYMNTGPYELI